MIRAMLLAAFILSLDAGGAEASLFCLIPRTADGFVALRAAPGAEGRLLLRMRANDEVQIVEGGRGGWERVRHWPGESRLGKGYDGFTEGYVARRLLKDCG